MSVVVVYVAWCNDCRAGGIASEQARIEVEARHHAVKHLGHETGIYELELPAGKNKFFAYELKVTEK